ncbi:16S rRNA (guanine(966)-N(2))-methyltransferase RsmD [Acinetobacter pollinis]|uniref:Ribosomal RNA small subunit methyltransferase D n=1 Tax=Acinetobacter pollinis TaxID=2605270 RepID=A0ABU6DRE5_9GAMM|nr:16S rRNA (guanine(966)-N(2))-methyltransferase RsmD [Acinetobacter pollinis]MEB5476431.1 16S rRNA (guanine(966)-N(2))-methyltransferase RsmD [Acinetobacter pollinis]
MKNQLRIIGGEWKRRQLQFASIDGLRPTPDRVRETLFNWLMWDIQNAVVLDTCTGSGALAFEALSRGASHVTLIEPNKKQAQFLQENIQTLNIQDKCNLHLSTAEDVLPKLKKAFDVVFLDPPYSLELWEDLSHLIDPLLKPEAFIYIEADRPLAQIRLPVSWEKIKETKAGTVQAGLYRKHND